MQRCFTLARMGRGRVAPNPMVGAVLVHSERIIGEGYHGVFGGPHAEVACLQAVPDELQHHIKDSVLYVSLEPCAHWGKTPPCADLIIGSGIRKVVIGCEDPFPQVAGKGIEKLEAAGIEVKISTCREEALALNKRFITFHKAGRPYVVLKWAQTGDSKMGHAGGGHPLKISSGATDRIVHRWRSEEAGILVGTNTALLDDPRLTTRLAPGKNPVRIVVDKHLRLPHTLRLFDGTTSTIILNNELDKEEGGVQWKKMHAASVGVEAILSALHQLQIQSVLVEGGSRLLQSFIDAGLWDEARVITNPALQLGGGVAAPVLRNYVLINSFHSGGDRIETSIRATTPKP